MNTNNTNNGGKNLQDELNKLRAENAEKLARKERELEIKVKIFELTGIEFMVMIHERKGGESVHIWAENDQYKTTFDRAKIEQYYNAVCDIYEPYAMPIKTADREYNNAAPVSITIENKTADIVFSHTQRAVVKFTFRNVENAAQDIELVFKFPAPPRYGNFSARVLQTIPYVGKPQNKRDRQEKTMYKVNGFNCINFYGNSYTTYTDSEDRTPELMQLAFTGDTRFKYSLEQLENVLSRGEFQLMTGGDRHETNGYTHGNKMTAILYPRPGYSTIQDQGNFILVNTPYKLYVIENVTEKEYDAIWEKYGAK